MVITLAKIEAIIIAESNRLDSEYNMKRRVIDMYEMEDTIKVCDSAYPIDWQRAVSKVFDINNIGNWCWAYQPNAAFGIPLPCCQRALTLLEIMMTDKFSINKPERLIYKPNYVKTFTPLES